MGPLPCGVNQSCLYVTYLSHRLKYSSITTYYQAVIFYHICSKYQPVRMSHPVLQATLRGIERSKGDIQKGKDPMLPEHLKRLADVVILTNDLDFLVFVTLLRVSHVVFSPHTLKVKDVSFLDDCCVLRVGSSKMK